MVKSSDLKDGKPVQGPLAKLGTTLGTTIRAVAQAGQQAIDAAQSAQQGPPAPSQEEILRQLLAEERQKTSAQQVGGDWSEWLGRLAMWAVLAAFGGVWWGLNGGYSVNGLKVGADMFGANARLFYELVAAWTFVAPVDPKVATALSLPVVQPVLPWVGVVATTILQVVAIYRRVRGLAIPIWMGVATVLLSGYDGVTTWHGLSEVQWIVKAGLLPHGLLTGILTYGLESLIGFLLGWQAKPKRR